VLAVLMFHDVVFGGDKYANDPAVLRAHLQYVRDNHPVVLPGDSLKSGQLNVCLTFDDGHASFYCTVYPMLQALDLRAVTGVSTDFIMERTDLLPEQRLSISSRQGQTDHRKNACFCTWRELREMQDSGLVQVACHSAGHEDLTGPDVDLDREVRGAGQIIADHLGLFPNTFIFPFGRVNRRVLRFTARHYPYRMRIGEALNSGWDNRGWTNPSGLLYRLQGDGLRDEQGPLRDFWKPRIRYYWNTLRFR